MSDDLVEETVEEQVISEDLDPREDPIEVSTEEPESEPVEEWTPDYKVKVMDQEYEFDEFIKPVVNKDNYDQIKGLYEKAYGLDHVKQKKTALEEDNRRLAEIEANYQKQNQSLGYMGNLIKEKDYHTLFSQLKIPDQEVMKYALDRVNYNELPPEEKAAYDSNIESRQRLRALEAQNAQFQQQFQHQTVQARASELDQYLGSDQIKDIASRFDQANGNPGAFRQEVISRAKVIADTTGKDISVQEAVDNVARVYSGFMQGQVPAGQENPQGQQQAQPAVAQAKPVIPSVKSGGSSPARKIPRTIDDLKAAAAAFDK